MRRLLLFCLLCFPVCLKADELFDYKKIPFPEPANFKEAKPDDVINGLRFLSMKENLSKDQRSRILAAARRIDPLHREAFTESYRLANGLSFEIDKGFSEKQKTDFFENSVAPLRKNSDFSEYLGFIDDAIKNQPFTSSTPKVTPGENTSGPRSIGFLSTKGFIPIRANSQRISSPNFQFVPKNLESFFFLSAYRETLKYFALHEGKSLSGKRITFEANLTNAKTEGPGAVLPTAILTSAFAGNFATTSDVAFVGDVNADGSIQPMGDILDRLTANPKNLPKIIVIPKDDAAVADDILILHGPSVFSKTQIVAVGNLEEAVGLVEAKRSAEMKEAINLFSQVQKVLNKPDGGKYLRNNYFVERVDRVLKLAPRHLSARQIKLVSQRRMPRSLSLDASFEIVFAALKPVIKAKSEIDKSGNLDPKGLARLNRFRARLDPSLAKLSNAAISFENSGRVGANNSNERARVAQRLKEELNAVSRNVKIREKMMK